jgi:uroporphyrinogen-III synthase
VENKVGILATKKLAPNQKQFLLNAGFWVMDEDFIAINPIDFEISTTEDLLIFTSQNAVQQVIKYKEKIRNKPALCVGEKTKQALHDHGFSVVQSLSDAEELVKIIATEYTDKSFTFFCGKTKLDTLPYFLQEKKIPHQIIEVYETLETPIKIAPKMDGILFFSPSGVSSYVKENKITNEICFCIGSTTEKAIKPYSKNSVLANQSTIENVIIQCINYFKATKND